MAASQQQDREFLTTAQAADFLQLSPKTLEGYRLKGGGPKYLRLGHRTVRYCKEDLRAWAQEQGCSATCQERRYSGACARLG